MRCRIRGRTFWFVFLQKEDLKLPRDLNLLEFLLCSSSYHRGLDTYPFESQSLYFYFGTRLLSPTFSLSCTTSLFPRWFPSARASAHLQEPFPLIRIPLSSYCSVPLYSFTIKLLGGKKILHARCIWGWQKPGCVWNSCECCGRELISWEEHFPEG